MKEFGIVYKATNKINGKVYIGQTTQDLNRRITQHKSLALGKQHDTYFNRSLCKYGVDNFEWEIIDSCYSRDELNSMEIKMIEKYNTCEMGYNITNGGEGYSVCGKRHHMYGKRRPKSVRDKISNTHEGVKLSGYHRRRISESKKGKKHHMYGKHHSEETKRKISQAQIGQKHHMYGKKCTKEEIQKVVDSISRLWFIVFPNGDKEIIKNLNKFCRENNLNASHMYDVDKGKRNHHGNYRCKKIYEELVICQT